MKKIVLLVIVFCVIKISFASAQHIIDEKNENAGTIGSLEKAVSEFLGHRQNDQTTLELTYRLSQDRVYNFPPGYRLKEGDQLRVVLSGRIEQSLSLRIDRNGNIIIPQAGVINILNQDMDSVRKLITQVIDSKFTNVNAYVVLVRPSDIQVSIYGFAVNKGTFQIPAFSNIFDALIYAGGLKKDGSLRNVLIQRKSGEKMIVDLAELMRKSDGIDDWLLENMDEIYIPVRERQIEVVGDVLFSGNFEIRENEKLGEVIGLLGGFINKNHSQKRIKVLRKNIESGRIEEVYNLLLDPDGDYRNAISFICENNDFIVVSNVTEFTPEPFQRSIVTIKGEVQYPGVYMLREGDQISTIIERAGGLTKDAYLEGIIFNRQSVREIQLKIRKSQLGQAALKQKGDLPYNMPEVVFDGDVAGRIAIDFTNIKDAKNDLFIENQDMIMIPAKPTWILVTGETYTSISLFYVEGKKSEEYIEQVQLRPSADIDNAFIIKPNGLVDRLDSKAVLFAGSIIVVPAKDYELRL